MKVIETYNNLPEAGHIFRVGADNYVIIMINSCPTLWMCSNYKINLINDTQPAMSIEDYFKRVPILATSDYVGKEYVFEHGDRIIIRSRSGGFYRASIVQTDPTKNTYTLVFENGVYYHTVECSGSYIKHLYPNEPVEIELVSYDNRN